MAVVLGTNAGFVTEAPVADPEGFPTSGVSIDYLSRAMKHTTPAGVSKITEIGWYQNAYQEDDVNYEVGLYSHDAGNDVPLNRLYADTVNSKGTAQGWKVASGLDWDVTAETIYWIAVQVYPTAPDTFIDLVTTGGVDSRMVNQASLVNPWVSAAKDTYILALYAKVESGSTAYEEGTKEVTAAVVVSLTTETVAITEGIKTVTTVTIVSLATESYKSNQGAVPDRPSDYDGDLYWDEDTGAWSTTRTTHPGNWVQYVLAISEEGDVYFRTV